MTSMRPEDSLRRLFDAIAPATDIEALADSLLSRPPRATPAWQTVAAGALAILVVIGLLATWLATGFTNLAAPPATTEASLVTSSATVPTVTTTVVDALVVDHLVLLDDHLAFFLGEANRVNTAWESRNTTFAEARGDLAGVYDGLSIEAQSVADDEKLAEVNGLDYPRLVDALTRAASAAEALVMGIEAPDDGTLRRDALAQLTAVVSEARRILSPFLPVQPEDQPVAVDSSYPDASRVISVEGIVLGTVDEDGAALATAIAPQVVIAARDSLLNDARYGLGATFLERKQALLGCPANETTCQGGGGLSIYTTVDFALQERARAILQDWFPPNSGLPTGAITMIDNRTGATVVMADGLDFGTDLEAGQRQYDLATKGRRSPGSAFMPFVFIAALEEGIPLDSYWDYSTPQTLDYGGAEPLVCSNAGDNSPGLRTLEEALYLATNTVFCQVAIEVGAENIVDVAHRMGIRSPLPALPALLLGAGQVSPLEMAAAFSTIANQGARVDNYLIERIEDADGNVIYQHQVESTQVIEPALAAAVISTLEKAVAIGTGRNADIDRPQFGKTGTYESYRDAWFVGGIPQVTTAVWVGYADTQREMRNVAVKPGREDAETIPRMFGSSAPAPIWAEFMRIVVADLPVEDFPEDPLGTDVYHGTP